ncbi:MAG: hypothetical protein K6U03_02380 [Firmicutes bacterium]|nr:hypothetical protein [Bacillota bacterium]
MSGDDSPVERRTKMLVNGSSSPSPGVSSGTGRIAAIMRGTRPWVMFLAILNFISAGFMVLSLLAMRRTLLPSAVNILGCFFCLFANFLLGLFLLRYAFKIAEYVSEPGEARLAEALEAQRLYWNFIGVMAIIGLWLVVLGVVTALLRR